MTLNGVMTLILRWVWPSEVGSRSRRYQKTCVFGKNDPLREDYENFVPKGFITSQIHVLCHCVQISWHLADRKSASHALFTGQNNKKIGSLSRSRFSADRAQNLPWPAANNVLTVPQISSKSVHFRRCYSRTREHRANTPQSVSNTRRSFRFFAE